MNGQRVEREVNLLLIDAPQAAPIDLTPEPLPMPEPSLPVIDDT
jgi:hypothetical protein